MNEKSYSNVPRLGRSPPETCSAQHNCHQTRLQSCSEPSGHSVEVRLTPITQLQRKGLRVFFYDHDLLPAAELVRSAKITQCSWPLPLVLFHLRLSRKLRTQLQPRRTSSRERGQPSSCIPERGGFCAALWERE